MVDSPAALRARLGAIPEAEVPLDARTRQLVDDSVAYLASPAALASLASDPYWPKWDSPWWHMLALFELGLAERIPKRTARAMVDALNTLLPTFPIREEDWPPGIDRRRQTGCHCALGSMDQVLAACGVDVDRELPWFAPWFARYQMRDGGYNCDETAYLVEHECPSSMVGTVPIFEALVRRDPSEAADRAAQLLLDRELLRGSPTVHNAAERTAAEAWTAPTFPRFYFYDVLRGLAAIVRYAVAHGRALPLAPLVPAIEHLLATAPDGVVRTGRRAWADKQTWTSADGWTERQPAIVPPLLAALGTVGAPNAALTAQWTRARRELIALLDAGRIG